MKSPEQMGESPEQPKEKSMKDEKEMFEKLKSEKLERKITTPEEAAKITQQRRADFDLEDARELTLEEVKKNEESIEKLLKDLDQYDLESCSPELQDEWYWVEQEAEAGKDRELAKANLERFLKLLQKESK